MSTCSNYGIGEWVGVIFLGIVECLPLANTLRMFILCSYTEPGVIPKVRSDKIDYNKSHYVAYRNPAEAHPEAEITTDSGKVFFSLNKFKIVI